MQTDTRFQDSRRAHESRPVDSSPLGSEARAVTGRGGIARRPPHARVTRDGLGAFVLVAPGVVFLIVFLLVPFVLAVGISFTNQRLVSPLPTRFVGLENYARVLGDPIFWRALTNNLLFALVVPVTQTALGLWLAVLINQRLPGMRIFRTIYFAPVVVALAVASVIWRLLYNTDNGLVNAFLGSISGGAISVDWLGNQAAALPAVMIMSVWQGVGFQMIVLLAGLQAIPRDMYEAATVDGAGRWQTFRFITLPSLRNTIIFVLTVSMILSFRLFDQVFVMTQGGGICSSPGR